MKTKTAKKKPAKGNWMKHLKEFMKAHKGISLMDAMKGAKKTYKR